MWFLKLTLRTKWITLCERAQKTVPENGVKSCVHFCLRSLLRLERCVGTYFCCNLVLTKEAEISHFKSLLSRVLHVALF